MAIDGTKIIDSDLAHDIYSEFIDLYDADINISEIRHKIEKYRENNFDEEEFEIFITAYALALWETGNLNDSIFEEVQQAISKRAGVEMWRNESGEFEAKARQKELDKFLRKISSAKKTPRKRKKYKKVVNFLFQVDDIVTFQVFDGTYRAAILIDIFQYRGDCIYQFIPTSFMNTDKPTEFAIEDSSVFINKIGSLRDKEILKQMQPGIENIWKGDEKFSLGLVIYGIEHRKLITFKENFEVIGKFKIKDCFKKIGSIGYENSFEDFAERFKDIIDYEVRIFKKEMIDLNLLGEHAI